MQEKHSSRRDFLKQSALAGVAASMTGALTGCAAPGGAGTITLPSGVSIGGRIGETRPRPSGQQPVHQLTTQPRARVRVAFIGCGGRGTSLIGDVLGIEFADVVAVCDLRPERAEAAAGRVEKARGKRPQVFGGTESIWEKLCELADIDVIYVATPWEWHVPMALRAMERGQHAFVEVSAAVTVEDCWRLWIRASARKSIV